MPSPLRPLVRSVSAKHRPRSSCGQAVPGPAFLQRQATQARISRTVLEYLAFDRTYSKRSNTRNACRTLRTSIALGGAVRDARTTATDTGATLRVDRTRRPKPSARRSRVRLAFTGVEIAFTTVAVLVMLTQIQAVCVGANCRGRAIVHGLTTLRTEAPTRATKTVIAVRFGRATLSTYTARKARLSFRQTCNVARVGTLRVARTPLSNRTQLDDLLLAQPSPRRRAHPNFGGREATRQLVILTSRARAITARHARVECMSAILVSQWHTSCSVRAGLWLA